MPVSAWISFDDHAVRVRGQQQPHDPEPRLGAERGEHVGVPGDVGSAAFICIHFYNSRNVVSSATTGITAP